MIAADILRGRARLTELKSDWDRLMRGGDYEPSVSFEWTAALMESHVQGDDDIAWIILKRGRSVIGIIPLVLRPTKILGQTVIVAFPVSELSDTHSDLLIEELSEPVLAAVVDALYRSGLSWDVFRMTRLLEARPLGAHLCEMMYKQQKRFEFRREQPSLFLTLDNTFEDYLRKRSGSFRNALKRIERKLMSRGTVTIRDHQDYPDVGQAYEVLLSIEQRSWKQAHGTAISSISRQTTFYRHLCMSAAQRQWLHLEFLYLDDRPVAYNLGLILKDTYFYLKTSYDRLERPFSPSTYLRAKLVESLIRQGVKRFDFPAEPYEWERQWTDEVRWHRSLTIFAPTLKGIAYGFYRKAKHLMRGADNMQIAYVNPRDLTSGHP